MVDLSDFNTAPSDNTTLSDMFATGTPASPSLNDGSIKNIATLTSTLTPDPGQTANQITQDLKFGDSSSTTALLKSFDIDNADKDKQTLLNLATDPTLPINQRAGAVQAFNNPNTMALPQTIASRVGQNALAANSEPTDNDEVEMVRVDTSQIYNKVDAYNGTIQKMINAQDNVGKPEGLNAMGQILQTMLPFWEQSSAQEVSGKLFGSDGNYDPASVIEGITLMGNSKEKVHDAVMAMPPDQRQALAQHVFDLVNATTGPAAFGGNHLTQMDLLKSYLTGGGYTDDNKNADNLVSVLDDTILVGPIVKGLGALTRGVRGAATAGKAVNAAKMSRFRAAIEEMGKPQTAEAVQGVADTAVGKPTTDWLVNNTVDHIQAFDKATSDQIAADKKILAAHFDNPNGDVNDVIDQMVSLDHATSGEIAQARSVITQAKAVGTASIPPEAIQGTKDLIGDKIVDQLSNLDKAPYEAFAQIRQAVSDRIDANGISSPTLGADIVGDTQGILTARGLGDIDPKVAGKLKSYATQAGQESNLRRRIVRTGVSPTSLSQIYKDTNPALARAADVEMVADNTDATAQKLYHTTRVDAVGNDTLPEVATDSGSVRNKVVIDEAGPQPNQAVITDLKESDVANQFTQSEKSQMRTQAKDDWRDVQGLVPRTEMSTVGNTQHGVHFGMVYGPKDGGFTDARQAIQQLKFGLAKYGVDDKDLEVLSKAETGDYLPTTEFDKPGDYLVRVNHDYEFAPTDTINWSLNSATKGWKMFDAFRNPLKLPNIRQGGLAQHFIPSTVVVDKNLLDAAARASDRASWLNQRLLQLGSVYAKKHNALEGFQKALVDDYIVKANAKSLKFDSTTMKAAGMTDDAVETVRSWKEVNDTLYHFDNQDLIKTLRNRGYMRYIDQVNHHDVIVRPLDIRKTGEVGRAFDSATGKIEKLDRATIQQIYERGGTLAATRSAIDLDGDTFEHVIVDNRSAQSYLRSIRDDDTILNYRDGYYQIKYTDPYFITKQIKAEDGHLYTRAIATAGDRKSAIATLNRLRTTDSKGLYGLRGDLKKGTDAYDDAEWEKMVSQGRTSQRVRGERLGNESETTADINTAHIASPEESLVNSIRSLSTRATHRDFIDAAKKRFTSQFSDLMPDDKGIPQWPESVDVLGANNAEVKLGRLADARNTWRYIDSIDSGYVNLLDDMSKNFLKGFSDTAGRMGWGWLEKGTRGAENFGVGSYAKKKAFRLLLAYNPIRQFPVQALQALPTILSTNPLGIPKVAARYIMMNYLARGGDVDSFFKATDKLLTGQTPAEAKTMARYFDLSGFKNAASANSYIRDDGKSLVDRSWFQRFRGITATPGNISQKFGFEAGENALMKSVWLSEYERLERAGKITAENVDSMNAKVRHMTGNMNRAGELPYNNNSLSALMQFFQMPHKMFAMTVMGHNGLTGFERAKLATGFVLTFGVGGGPITSLISNILPGNKDNLLAQTIEGGVFNILFNKALGALYHGNVDVDFSDSLRQLTIPQNIFQFVHDLIGLQVGQIASNSPSASLVFGQDPRVTNFVKAVARPFTIKNDWTGPEMVNIGTSFLQMFSGGSNFFKAKYMLEHGMAMNSTGAITDYDTNYVEAMMKAAGFSTMDEVKRYALNEQEYRNSETFKSDIGMVISGFSEQLARQGISNAETGYWMDMMGEAQRIYGNNPFYLREFQKQLTYKATAGKYDLFNSMLRQAEFTSPDKMMEMINSAPSNLTPDQIATLKGAIKIINQPDNGE